MKITVSPPIDWEMLMLVLLFIAFVTMVFAMAGVDSQMDAQDIATKQDRARIMRQYSFINPESVKQ